MPSTLAEYVKSSPSTSDPDNGNDKDVSSSIVWSSIVVSTGASFTAFIVIVIVADKDVSSTSVTKYVNVVMPLKSKSGVNVAIDPSNTTKPFSEAVTKI